MLAGLATLALGVRPMVFRSGSMAPAIDTGALAFAHETAADELAVGDIVSVTTSTGSRDTHRITRVTIDEQGVGTLETAGPSDISFLSNRRYRRLLPATRARTLSTW